MRSTKAPAKPALSRILVIHTSKDGQGKGLQDLLSLLVGGGLALLLQVLLPGLLGLTEVSELGVWRNGETRRTS